MRTSIVLAIAASLSTASAALQGFNYGSTKSDGSFMYEADFQSKFTTAQNLVGTSGFSSARLYTMIQGGSSTNEPTQAIQAAINTKTSLLLGLWASGGEGFIQGEITALKTAISKFGPDFTSLVVGISVGSEDLYRVSPTGIAADSGYGADPDTLVSYISQVRSAIAGTALSAAPIGHVDTWTSWVNGSNSAVWDACDWVGMDAYPYFQNSMANGVDTGASLFNDALSATKGSTGKDVWVTETGWPVSGPTENDAVASVANAKAYWDAVACPLLGKVNTWWFTLQDADPTVPSPSFGIVGSTLSTTPLFDLSCNAVSGSSSASSGGSSSTSAPSSSSTPTGSSGSGSSSQSKASSVSSSISASVSGSISASASGSVSSVASGASSLSSAASATNIVSSGGGLSPSQGGGSGSSGSSNTVSSSAASTGLTGTSSPSVVATSKPAKASSTAPSSTSVESTNSAVSLGPASIVAAFAAILAAALLL